MTYLLSIDPGLNTGAALGFYDAVTPYRLLERYQIHDGVPGFVNWWEKNDIAADEIVCEKFILAEENDFDADLTPVQVEGALMTLTRHYPVPIWWQDRTAKGGLIGYTKEQKVGTLALRQRARFDFLERFGMFVAGTENDDSNDAITHALVNLRRRKHYPTMMAFWPPRVRG